MNKPATLIVSFLLLFGYANAQNDSVLARIVLIGDAGSLKNGTHPVVSAVRKNIPMDKVTTVLYLGDNLYTYGLPDDAYAGFTMAAAILDSQINIAQNTPAKVIFIPGNHDWGHEGKDGWAAVMREQQYIDGSGIKNVSFYPKDGCPGPIEIKLGKQVVLIIMDTQWWLHPYDKPGIESDCPYKTKDEVLNQLDDIVSKNADKLILFATHHPFKSNGIHGGYFTLKQHIFPLTDYNPSLYIPLPIIGSIYPITRGIFGTPQDLKHPAYQNMVNDLMKVLKNHPNVVFAAGHEHNLQLIKDSSYNYIISGSGTNKTRVSKSKRELYGAEENGFVTLEVMVNKHVKVAFYTVKGDSTTQTYASTILDFSTLPRTDSTPNNLTVTAIPVPFEDSVIVSASEKYDEASALKRFFLGNNYRKEWAAKVKLKVFDLNKINGGMEILSLGGGKQTTSLRLKDKEGKEWALRTIDKNPEKAIPEFLRGTIAQDIVDDMISASHPYAALSIPDLAKAVHVVVATPKYYFVPDDPAFGIYRSRVANTVCLLEEREPTPDETDTKSTQKVMSKVLEDNDNTIDQPQVLRARLLDMFIGDWDRHLDQWKWGTRDTGKGKVYYAIPRDRDQAFFNSDGLFLKALSLNLFRYLKGFSKNINDVNWLNWEERDLDRFFLNRLTRTQWKNIIDTFQHDMSDSVIEAAINKMPREIVAIDGDNIISKLKSRRDDLMKQGLIYYAFLAQIVTVPGTNDKEYYKITTESDSLRVQVYKRKKSYLSLSTLMFDRKFDERETKEIWLYGLNDDDYYNVDANTNSKIKLRIIGGKGSDTFNIAGNISNSLYDLNTKENHIINHNRSRILTSDDPKVNDYTPITYRYNIFEFPKIKAGYNADDKLLLGLGFIQRKYGFRKEPYASEQRFSALSALSRGSYQLKYQGEFNHVLGNTDLMVNAALTNPTLDNFFGFGNNTVIDHTKYLDYYKVRYKYLNAEVLFRKRVNAIFHVMAGPVVYHYWDRFENNKGRIMEKPALLGLDSANVYSLKTYVGGKISLLLNNLDNVLLPTRGIQWRTDFTALGGLTDASKPYTAITSDMAVHASLNSPAKFVVVVRFGGGHIFSKNYEYFQTMNLGTNNYLRGFRKDRFSGTSVFYNSIEFRIKLFESKSYILPGSIGLVAFNDIGKVWLKGQHSDNWHDAYGGGFYYAAYDFVLVSATLAFSKEDRIFNFSIGTKFNLTF